MNLQKISTITSYFRINFDFFEPYSIILDGNFIKLLVERNQPFARKVEDLLAGKVFTKVTQCIVSELQILGDQFRFVLLEAKKHQLIKCRHPMGYSASDCIKDLIGSKNAKKFMICTQDLALRRVIRELPNVPIFYFGPDQRITMEDIPKKNKELLQQSLKKKMLPKQHEVEPIKQYKKEEFQRQKEQEKREWTKQASLLGVKVKKLAKGPNPLSMKKKAKVPKQPRNNENNQTGANNNDKEADSKRKNSHDDIQHHQHNDNSNAAAESHQQHNNNNKNSAEVHRPKRIRKRKNKNKAAQEENTRIKPEQSEEA